MSLRYIGPTDPPLRGDNGKLLYWHECPYCGKRVARRKCDGRKIKSCGCVTAQQHKEAARQGNLAQARERARQARESARPHWEKKLLWDIYRIVGIREVGEI